MSRSNAINPRGRAPGRGVRRAAAPRGMRHKASPGCEALEGRSLLSMVWSGPWIAGRFQGSLPRGIDLSPRFRLLAHRLGLPAPADAQGSPSVVPNSVPKNLPKGPLGGLLKGAPNGSPHVGPNMGEMISGAPGVSSTVRFDEQNLINDLHTFESELPGDLANRIHTDEAAINQALANAPAPGGGSTSPLPQGSQGLRPLLLQGNMPPAQVDSILADLASVKQALVNVDPALTVKINADHAKLAHDAGQIPTPTLVVGKPTPPDPNAPLSKDMTGKTITTTTNTNTPPPPTNVVISPRGSQGGGDTSGGTTVTPTGRGGTT